MSKHENYITMKKDGKIAYVKKDPANEWSYTLVESFINASSFPSARSAHDFVEGCVATKKQKYFYVYVKRLNKMFHVPVLINKVLDELDCVEEEAVSGSDEEIITESELPAEPKPCEDETISHINTGVKIKQSELRSMSQDYDIDYDNSALVDKTSNFIQAYMELAKELESHKDVKKTLVSIEKEFMDCRHIIEFANFSSISAFHMLNLEKKILLKRRAYKDTIRILDALKSFQRVTTVANANAVIDAIANLDERHYGLRTKEFADILN